MLSTGELEQLAQEACFSVNLEVKTRAEKWFAILARTQSLPDCINLVSFCSETVAFVVLEYLNKGLTQREDLIPLLQQFVQLASSWFRKDTITFVRQSGPLSKYVANSLGLLIGNTLKQCYRNAEWRETLMNVIKSAQEPNFQLYLWRLFLQAVSLLDMSMGFLSYRNLVFSFQQEIIPETMVRLLPHFGRLQENVKISELMDLQEQLSIGEAERKSSTVQVVAKEDHPYFNLVLGILKQITCFTYNITYSEYELECTFQSCLISFPEALTRKLLSQDFATVIYYLLDRLLRHSPNSHFIEIVFQCLRKVVMAKNVNVSAEIKAHFVRSNLTGLTQLLNLRPKKASMLFLIEVNRKFIISGLLKEAHTFREEYSNWLTALYKAIVGIIRSSPLNFDNSLLMEALETYLKYIEGQIRQDYNGWELDQAKNTAHSIVEVFLEELFSPRNSSLILGSTELLKVTQLSKIAGIFFGSIKSISSLNYTQFFRLLKSKLEGAFQNGNLIHMMNGFLLVSQICDYHYLERNILSCYPDLSELADLGGILMLCLQYVSYIQQNGSPLSDVSITIDIFIRKLLSEGISKLELADNKLKVNSRLYLILEQAQNPSPQPCEEFILCCLRLLMTGIRSENLLRVAYVFDCARTLLMSLKWSIKREGFKTSNLFKQLNKEWALINQMNFTPVMYKYRKHLYRIISFLNFDDILDAYRENLDEVIQRMRDDFQNGQVVRILYDLLGVCSSVDTSIIYRYFLTRFDQVVGFANIFDYLFTNFSGERQILKSTLKLSTTIIENKSTRLSHQRNAMKLYELLKYFLPHWNNILSKCQGEQQACFFLQLMRILGHILRGTHINLCLLEKVSPIEEGRFLELMLEKIAAFDPWISCHEKINDLYNSNMLLLNRDALEVIISHRNKNVPRNYAIVMEQLMQRSRSLMDRLLGGEQKAEAVLDKGLDAIKCMYAHMREAIKLKHKTSQLESIAHILASSQIKTAFIFHLFLFGSGNGKNASSLLREVCQIINHMCEFHSPAIEMAINRLGLVVERHKQKLIAIITNARSDGQSFVCQLKDWFKECDTVNRNDPIQY